MPLSTISGSNRIETEGLPQSLQEWLRSTPMPHDISSDLISLTDIQELDENLKTISPFSDILQDSLDADIFHNIDKPLNLHGKLIPTKFIQSDQNNVFDETLIITGSQ